MVDPISVSHVTATTRFLDDHPEPQDLVHASVVTATIAHGRILKIDTRKAEKSPGVLAIYTARDIDGQNQIGPIIQDEPLLAEDIVTYWGQPLMLIIALKPEQAWEAAKHVAVKYHKLPTNFCARTAAAQGNLIAPSRTFVCGHIEKAWKQCHTIVEGLVETGGQEHLYFEAQGSMAIPLQNGKLKIIAGTQSPTAVQRVTARVLGKKMNAIEVEVPRLGGAFGGKEDQATPWAALAALAANKLQRAVKIILPRHIDMQSTGKRHPYSSSFKIGLDAQKKILAYEVSFYQNAGAHADLSTSILERTLFHATNSYYIPHVRATAFSCRTNLPPFTAFRGFGGPQGMFVIEAAIAKAATVLNIRPYEIQQKNLLKKNDHFPYGARVQQGHSQKSFSATKRLSGLTGRIKKIDAFNRKNRRYKKGLSLMPVCFGISFTNTMLNQAGALIHVYTDGSVNISTGAVEMGQGVNAKMAAIATHTLGIDPSLIHVENTNTSRVANTSPTAASAGADLNGMATQLACQQILDRLSHAIPPNKKKKTLNKTDWENLVRLAYSKRINLSAQAHYATPHIFFDKTTETGNPFSYHVFGTAFTEVTIDSLLGTYTIDGICIVHDAGKSLNPLIDQGQLEGALLQGIGWVTSEEVLYDQNGRLISDSLTTYKIPDLHFIPKKFKAIFLSHADNPRAVLQSKGIGEPPLMYGIGTYFALQDAIQAAKPGAPDVFSSPLTPEKILMQIHRK